MYYFLCEQVADGLKENQQKHKISEEQIYKSTSVDVAHYSVVASDITDASSCEEGYKQW